MSGKQGPPLDGPEEKQPILHIKKGAERDVPLYYERLKRLSYHDIHEEEKPKRGGFRLFRGGRSSLLPLLILALGAVVVFRLVPARDRSTASLEGMSVSLRVVEYRGTVQVSLTFSGGLPHDPVTASAVCSLEGRGEPLALSGGIGGGNSVLRGSMEEKGAGRTMTAEVTVGNVKRTLKRKVQVFSD